MSDTPPYFTAATLAAYTGVSRRTLDRHIADNVCGLKDARENEKGIGMLFPAAKCKTYIAKVKARQAGKEAAV